MLVRGDGRRLGQRRRASPDRLSMQLWRQAAVAAGSRGSRQPDGRSPLRPSSRPSVSAEPGSIGNPGRREGSHRMRQASSPSPPVARIETRAPCPDRSRSGNEWAPGRGFALPGVTRGGRGRVRPAPPHSFIGTTGSFLVWRMVRAVRTLSTFGVAVSSRMMKFWKACRSGTTHFSRKSTSPDSM